MVSIINSFHTVAPKSLKPKPSRCTPYSLRAFQRYQECGKKHHGLGDLSMANKTKQTTFLHR